MENPSLVLCSIAEHLSFWKSKLWYHVLCVFLKLLLDILLLYFFMIRILWTVPWRSIIGNAEISLHKTERYNVAVLWSVSVPPKFICWNPNARCAGIRRQGLWEVIRPWRWSLINCINLVVPHERDSTEVSDPFHHVRIQPGDTSRKRALTHPPMLAPWSWTFQPPELWEINFCCL